MRIVKLNSSEGISPWYLLLGGLASISNLTNVSILQAPYVACCPSVVRSLIVLNPYYLVEPNSMLCKSPRIDPNVRSMANVSYNVKKASQRTSIYSSAFRFILYFKMYPENLKFTQNDTLSRNWALSLKIKRIVKVYSFFLLLLMLSWAIFLGFPQPIATAFAWILGVFSMLLSLLQFLPQIYQTIIHKVRISTMIMTILLCYCIIVLLFYCIIVLLCYCVIVIL